MSKIEDKKIEALAKFLDIDASRIKKTDDEWRDDLDKETLYVVDNDYSFYVADDEQADQLAEQRIKDSLWAFNTSFIAEHSQVIKNSGSRGIAAFDKMQEVLCEDANAIVEAVIDDMDAFISDAIAADGRGHFIANYDGGENEISVDGHDFNIYCMDIDEVEKEIEDEYEDDRS